MPGSRCHYREAAALLPDMRLAALCPPLFVVAAGPDAPPEAAAVLLPAPRLAPVRVVSLRFEARSGARGMPEITAMLALAVAAARETGAEILDSGLLDPVAWQAGILQSVGFTAEYSQITYTGCLDEAIRALSALVGRLGTAARASAEYEILPYASVPASQTGAMHWTYLGRPPPEHYPAAADLRDPCGMASRALLRNGRLVGLLVASLDGETARIASNVLVPAETGSGANARLMLECARAAQSEGMRRIQFDALSSSRERAAFARRIGARETKRLTMMAVPLGREAASAQPGA